MKIPDFTKDNFIVANEEDGGNMWGIGFFPPGIAWSLAKCAKLPPLYNMIDFKGEHIRLLVPERYWGSVTQKLFQRTLNNPDYLPDLAKKTKIAAGNLIRFSSSALHTDCATITDKQLARLFDTHSKLVVDMLGWGMISTAVEIPYSLLTNYVETFLTERVLQLGLKVPVGELFYTLSSITLPTAQHQEYLGLLRLLTIVEKKSKLRLAITKKDILSLKKDKNFWLKLSDHLKHFCWAYYGYNGPAFNEHRVVSELRVLLQNKTDSRAELTASKHEVLHIPRKIELAEKLLKLSNYEKKIFRAFRATATTKLIRKDALTHSFYALEPALKEFAKRCKISMQEARFLAPFEHGQVLRGNKKLLKQLKSRFTYSVFTSLGNKPKILVGKQAKKYVNSFYKEQKAANISEMKGQIACLGHAKGKIKIVNLPSDMKKMQQGDILLAVATTPDIVPAMKKAGAIITDMGGITSHAAIVSRELKIPCVIGLKVATKIFNDGDMIEVDANSGVIKKL